MTIWIWVGFVLLVLGFLLLDLGVFHRKSKVISFRAALGWTAFWVALALLFNVFVYFLYERHWLGWFGSGSGDKLTGAQAALQFFTGYVIEKSLSADNIFVIAMVFAYFNVPAQHQHRVLFWGIMGALVMRGIMIAIGAAMIERFTWSVYVFGAILIVSALKMLKLGDEELHPDRNLAIRVARRLYPVTTDCGTGRFFSEINGRRAITPVFLALILVETSDVMFAIDSIPAIFAVTSDPFLVFTSNIFALLGLRSLYFAIAGLMSKFRYLKLSLVVLLMYVGVKMLLTHYVHIPVLLSLGIIMAILSAGIIASLLWGKDEKPVTTVAGPVEDEVCPLPEHPEHEPAETGTPIGGISESALRPRE